MSDVTDAIAKAARLFERLDHTTDDLEEFCTREGNEAFDGWQNDRAVTFALDTIGFQCNACSYWKRQRENATPDDQRWVCQECKSDGY